MGNKIKVVSLFIAVVIGAIIIVIAGGGHIENMLDPNKSIFDDSYKGTSNIMARASYEKKARKFAKQGMFEEALVYYQKATRPELINEVYEQSTAMGAMREIYKWKENYEMALKMNQWFLDNSATGEPTPFAIDEQNEIKALIAYQNNEGEAQSEILSHIEYLKQQYELPSNYVFGNSGAISDIVRLYDTIGAHESGVKFIDEILSLLKQKQIERGEDAQIYDQIENSDQAAVCAGAEVYPVTDRNPDWRTCRNIHKYLLAREAFEKDKAEGTKGRATQVIIKHFVW